MRRFFGIVLLLFGFCSFFFADNSWIYVPMGIAFLIWGGYLFQTSRRRWRRRRRRPAPYGRPHGYPYGYDRQPPRPQPQLLERNSNYVYDRNGELHDVSSWEERVPGRVYADGRTGMIAERDKDGYLHLVQ